MTPGRDTVTVEELQNNLPLTAEELLEALNGH